MKKIYYVVVVLALFLVSANKLNCQQWLVSQTTGMCLQDVRQETTDYTDTYIDYEYQEGRWLILKEIAIPDYPVLLGSNFNKYRIVPVSVYYQYDMPSIYIQGKLICDSNGSDVPRLAISIPAQAGYVANIHFSIVNWNIIYEPCGY